MKLTPKQERFVQEYLVDLNATAAEYEEKLKSFVFSPFCFATEKFYLIENPEDTIVTAYSILLDDNAEAWRKKACYLLLRAFVRYDFLEYILKDDAAPFDRNDKRVRVLIKVVKNRGACELCGSKENLEAHHVMKWSEYPRGRVDLKNGVCLCAKCHAKQHEGEPAERLILSKVGGRNGG